jgi:adenylate cyclase
MGTDVRLTVLFADIVGSTRLYELMGEAAARTAIAQCLELMKSATIAQRGTVIKTMGDEVMATFETANGAIEAAAQMQRRVGSMEPLGPDRLRISLRIGCHYGPVVVEHRDVFGTTVHIANRVTSQAKGAQIMTTVGTVERLSADWRMAARQVDVATLKGRRDEFTLYEVLWNIEEATGVMIPTRPVSGEKRPRRLRLVAAGGEVSVDDRNPTVRLGRAEDADLVLQGGLISRLHARIEASRTYFTLYDQSTNGCYVVADQGTPQFVRRDNLHLTGSGLIGLGHPPADGAADTLRYVCED